MNTATYKPLLAKLHPLCAAKGCQNPRTKGRGFSCISVNRETGQRTKVAAGFCQRCMDVLMGEYKFRSAAGGITLERLHMDRVFREDVTSDDPITEEKFHPFKAEQVLIGEFGEGKKWEET